MTSDLTRVSRAAQEFRDALLEAYEKEEAPHDWPEWFKNAALVHDRAVAAGLHPSAALRIFLDLVAKGDPRELH